MTKTPFKAIFIKQYKDVSKNSDVVSQFVIFPFLAFIMTSVVDMGMPGISPSFFVTMFAGMFAGMAFISAVATAIAEDIEKNSLRFLLMAGVKSHEYLLGIGGIFLTIGMAGSLAFTMVMPDVSVNVRALMFISLLMGTASSILFGAILGMACKNQQQAVALGSLSGIVVSFGPFIANMSQNQTLLNIFRFLYTMNFIDETASPTEAAESLGIIFANILILALIFTWVYGKHDVSNKGGKAVNKKAIGTILVAGAIGYGAFSMFMWNAGGSITTDNAQVATRTVPITTSGGVLERFTISQGQEVRVGDILGWVEGQDAMRSPVDGVVMEVNAVQGQRVLPMEAVALISDRNSLHIQANIQETDILQLSLGQKVYVGVDTFGGQVFEGYVAHIGGVALPRVGNTTTRTTLLIPVEVNIVEEVGLERLIGVNASVRIPLR